MGGVNGRARERRGERREEAPGTGRVPSQWEWCLGFPKASLSRAHDWESCLGHPTPLKHTRQIDIEKCRAFSIIIIIHWHVCGLVSRDEDWESFPAPPPTQTLPSSTLGKLSSGPPTPLKYTHDYTDHRGKKCW